MIRERADIAILGGGFAGSVLALVLARIGRRVILVERGTHPRFAIGESSTPLANLALEELGRKYDLPQLFALSEYGRWQVGLRNGVLTPPLACGLKRGFSYYQHHAGVRFQSNADHANELLVAASPMDDVSDTHWFREHFDHFLVREAQRAGVPYYDRTDITFVERARQWQLRGHRGEVAFEATARFLIDATGPASLLARTEGIDTRPTRLRTNCWSVYSHFVDVPLWEGLAAEAGVGITDYPYPCDDAALHHLLDDGWIWVLRFNNGVTSAGVAYDSERHPAAQHEAMSSEAIWTHLLHRYPSIGAQFGSARAVQPFVRTGRLQRCAERVVGPDWAMLAHAAYFLDPFFSSGNAHSLLTIQRLAEILECHWQRPSLVEQLHAYQRALLREVDFLDLLIHGCYRTFGRFPLFAGYSMYYFAAAILSETRRRGFLAQHRPRESRGTDELPWPAFLACDQPGLRAAVQRSYEALPHLSERDAPTFLDAIAHDIASFNWAGLCDPAKRNLYPFVAGVVPAWHPL